MLIAGNALEVMLLQHMGKLTVRMLKKHDIGQSAAKPLTRFIAMRKVQRLGEIRKGQEPLKCTGVCAMSQTQDIVPTYVKA